MLKFEEEIKKEVPKDDSADIGEKMLLYGLIRATRPSVCVETGTHRGLTSLYLAHALYDNDKGKLYTADPFDWGASGNFRKFPELEKIIDYQQVKGRDIKVKGKIDFLFIDGFHEKEEVESEIKSLFPKLSNNAIVVFHDCELTPSNGVNQAVSELKTVYIETKNRMRIYEHSKN